METNLGHQIEAMVTTLREQNMIRRVDGEATLNGINYDTKCYKVNNGLIRVDITERGNS